MLEDTKISQPDGMYCVTRGGVWVGLLSVGVSSEEKSGDHGC